MVGQGAPCTTAVEEHLEVAVIGNPAAVSPILIVVAHDRLPPGVRGSYFVSTPGPIRSLTVK
jgi:hypothetical protein